MTDTSTPAAAGTGEVQPVGGMMDIASAAESFNPSWLGQDSHTSTPDEASEATPPAEQPAAKEAAGQEPAPEAEEQTPDEDAEELDLFGADEQVTETEEDAPEDEFSFEYEGERFTREQVSEALKKASNADQVVTRRTQEASAAEKAAKEAEERATQTYQQLQQGLAQIDALAKAGLIDMEEPKPKPDEDPFAFHERQVEFAKRQEMLKPVVEAAQKAHQDAMARMNEDRTAALGRLEAELTDYLPALKKPGGMERFVAEYPAQMKEHYGFEAQELGTNLDPRLHKLAIDALKWRRSQGAGRTAKAKVTPAGKRTLKPGGARETVTAATQRKAAAQKAVNTSMGSLAEAAKAFKDFGFDQ